MERSQFTFYRSYYEALKKLPKKDREAAVMAICEYALNGQESTLSGIASVVFSLVKPTLNSGRKKAESGKRGGSKNAASVKQSESKPEAKSKQEHHASEIEREIEIEIEKEYECISPDPPNRGQKKFVPPSVEEVSAYCQERNSAVEPQEFIDFYASKGWMVGKTPMKDWKAACRNAEKWDRWGRKDAKASQPSYQGKVPMGASNAPLGDFERQAIERLRRECGGNAV